MEGSFAFEAVESFFVTFFTDKESKSGNPCGFQERYYILLSFNLNEFNTTVTEEKLIAIPAYIGLNITPNKGKNTPAAKGMPAAL